MFTLNEALAAISNKKEFAVHRREFGWVIDYNVSLKDTFVGKDERQTLILKNLRGTCFNTDGEIISLAFDKFHNLNECDGWREVDIDFSKQHHILEKLDGSMIRAIPMLNGSYRLGTRAGITEVAMKAEKFIASLSISRIARFDDLVRTCLRAGMTPLFEFCSRDQRIVIDYPVADLVLLGVRANDTGAYMRRNHVEILGRNYSWSVVKAISSEHSSLKELASVVRQFKEDEGVVVTFDHGFRVKIKADEYVLKHRALDGLRFEKDVVALILGNSLDDVLPIVDEKTRGRLTAFRDSMMFQISYHELTLKKIFDSMKHLERKEFAEWASKDKLYSKFLFKMLDGKEANVMGYVLSKTGTQANLESVRRLVGKSFLDF